MGYTRTFTKTIRVDYSGSVRYPASQSGGTQYYSGSTTEDVVVTVEVDTDPFDSSIVHCDDKVDMLTAAVSATEVAQVESIQRSSQMVAGTIVEGFFKTVRSDLSTRIAELSQMIDSKLMLLKKQSENLRSKRLEMEQSYHRLRERYNKLFADLNDEVEMRIKRLDQPVFQLAETAKIETDRMLDTDLSEVVTQSNLENTVLNSQISAAVTRKNGEKAIGQAVDFLRVQKTSDRVVSYSAITSLSADSCTMCLPVCYAETSVPNGGVDRLCVFDHTMIDSLNREEIEDLLFVKHNAPNMILSEEGKSMLESFFTKQVDEEFATKSSEHDVRVRKLISKMFYNK